MPGSVCLVPEMVEHDLVSSGFADLALLEALVRPIQCLALFVGAKAALS